MKFFLWNPPDSPQQQALQKVIATAERLDFDGNPAGDALYKAGISGFQVYCTPTDHPGDGWDEIAGKMKHGRSVKPGELVGWVNWLCDR